MKMAWRERLSSTYRESRRRNVLIFVVMRILIIVCMFRQLGNGYYPHVLLCMLSLALISIPGILKKKLRISLPNVFEVAVCLFVYGAEILGEIENFYGIIPMWDTMLHTINGFLAAAVGFGIIDLLNAPSKRINMTPLFVALVSLCFSMTVGVMWEFAEFGIDAAFHTDMQKDWVVQSVSSVNFDAEQANNAATVDGIAYTVLYDENGGILMTVEGGYLDIGIIDTMKDLWVNLLGAVVFSVCGYLYVHRRDKYKFAGNFIITKTGPSGPLPRG